MRLILAVLICAVAACSRAPTPPTDGKALNCPATEDGEVTVENAWLREQADPAGMSAAYFSVCNGTMATVELTGAAVSVSGAAELHETTRDENGVVSMAPLGRVALKPGERVLFEPGGKHVMLMGLTQPIASGDVASLTLQFDAPTTITVDAVVKSNVEAASGHDGH